MQRVQPGRLLSLSERDNNQWQSSTVRRSRILLQRDMVYNRAAAERRI